MLFFDKKYIYIYIYIYIYNYYLDHQRTNLKADDLECYYIH